MKKLTSILMALVMIVSASVANAQGSHEEKSQSWSVMSGFMFLKRSQLSTNKFSYERGHFALVSDFTFDAYREKWDDNSRSKFHLYGASIGARYYTRPLGRGLFAEAYAGSSYARLISDGPARQNIDKGFIPMAGFGAGWRFGRKPKGLFGEIGFRSTYALKTVHLFTTEERPSDPDAEAISYQSWRFSQGKATGQLYLGIGYSF